VTLGRDVSSQSPLKPILRQRDQLTWSSPS
jgi:hypothetical protein